MGDWNPSGRSIERNVREFLYDRGWRGTWTLLAVLDDDAERLPPKHKIDRRHRPPLAYESVESEAVRTTELRRRLTDWLDSLLPDGFDWDEHKAPYTYAAR